MRRHFPLLEADERTLNARGYEWESVSEGDTRWVLIHGYPVPAGLGHREVDLAVQVPKLYPSQELDMAWFFPALARGDGRDINATSPQAFDGRQFQRWSRHREKSEPWRVGVDDLRSHLVYVDLWLEREVA